MWVALLLALVGCNQIIGLDEREYAATAGDGGIGVSTGELSCDAYCDEVLSLCTADKDVQQFTSKPACLGVCDKYPKESATSGNTLACRVQLLKNIEQTGESATYCSGAGPGGSAPPGEDATAACGSNCESFCALRRATCKPVDVESECESKCKGLVDKGGFSAESDFASGVDTLQCRIAHLSAAANFLRQGKLDDRDAHCQHSGIRSKTQCDFKQDKEISCESYCQVVGTACAGNAAVYDSTDQCLKVCAKIPSGTSMDVSTAATRRCIREGAYDALELGPRVCPFASPAPERCGGGQCASFCRLAQQTCDTQFKGAFPNGLAQCEESCKKLPGVGVNQPYSVEMDQAKRGPTFQCRLLRLTRAMEGQDTCNGVFGIDECR